MLPRVGVIGPWEWMGRLAQIVPSFPETIFQLLGYRDSSEIPDILGRCRGNVDGLLFCGKNTETIGAPHVPDGIPVISIRYDLHCVIRTLCEIVRDHPGALERGVTIDTLSAEDIKELCAELDIDAEVIHHRDFRDTDNPTVISFHVDHFRRGSVVALATGRKAAHRMLLPQGLPAYYVRPTNAALKDSLQRIASTVRYARSANAHVAVLVVEVVSFTQQPDDGRRPNVTEREADLYGLLRRATARAKCSLTTAGPGSYIIFATKGSLPALAGEFLELPFVGEARLKAGATLNVGIGLGQTASQAHDHALASLLRARELGGGAACLVHADGKVTGPIRPTAKRIPQEAPDPRLVELARLSRIAVPTLAELIRWAQINSQNYVTVADLAKALQVTPRTSRRILSTLCDHELAHIVSEERKRAVGRPRFVYELALNRLSTPAQL